MVADRFPAERLQRPRLDHAAQTPLRRRQLVQPLEQPQRLVGLAAGEQHAGQHQLLRLPEIFQTHEYATPDPAPTAAWELTRGLGRSFGYNAKETAADTLTGTQLVHLLADVVAHGGNLVIDVGPDGAGHIPDLQQRPLRELGAWLDRNGDAIYATRPWSTAATTTADGHQVRYTQKDGTVFAIVLADQLTGTLTVRGLTLPPGSRVGILDGPGDLAWVQTATGVRITPPPQPPRRHAHVLTITTDGQARGRIVGPW